MQPNILFLFADQMHGFAMSCMGHPDIKTPNLDRLAARGTLFRHAYSCAPVCTPFRAMLMTGRYGCQTGSLGNDGPLPPGEHFLADGLNAAGYHTSYVGKWHLGGTGNKPVPREHRYGFTDFLGYQCYNSFTSGIQFFDEEHRLHEFQGHRTNVTTSLAIERLDRARAAANGRPIGMFVSYQNPHYPLQPAPEFEAMYEHGSLTKRANHRPETEPWTGTWSPHSQDRAKDAEYQKYGGNMDRYLRLYYAMVSQLDHEISRLLQHLDQTGLAQNTIVVFTSDHGDMQGSHGFTNKSRFYEESTRIPLIVRDPRQSGGTVIDCPVGSIDFTPTLLDWARISTSAPEWRMCEGKSLTPFLQNTNHSERRPVFIEEIGFFGIVIRQDNHKLVMHRHSREATHLFDLAADPCEMNNLINDTRHAPIQRELLARANAWFDDAKSRANPHAKFPKFAVSAQ